MLPSPQHRARPLGRALRWKTCAGDRAGNTVSLNPRQIGDTVGVSTVFCLFLNGEPESREALHKGPSPGGVPATIAVNCKHVQCTQCTRFCTWGPQGVRKMNGGVSK